LLSWSEQRTHNPGGVHAAKCIEAKLPATIRVKLSNESHREAASGDDAVRAPYARITGSHLSP
jgi:hypothetical protein